MSGSFAVRVEAFFEAAHNLRSYHGSPEPLHGHSYKVEAELAASGGGVDGEAIAVGAGDPGPPPRLRISQ